MPDTPPPKTEADSLEPPGVSTAIQSLSLIASTTPPPPTTPLADDLPDVMDNDINLVPPSPTFPVSSSPPPPPPPPSSVIPISCTNVELSHFYSHYMRFCVTNMISCIYIFFFSFLVSLHHPRVL